MWTESGVIVRVVTRRRYFTVNSHRVSNRYYVRVHKTLLPDRKMSTQIWAFIKGITMVGQLMAKKLFGIELVKIKYTKLDFSGRYYNINSNKITLFRSLILMYAMLSKRQHETIDVHMAFHWRNRNFCCQTSVIYQIVSHSGANIQKISNIWYYLFIIKNCARFELSLFGFWPINDIVFHGFFMVFNHVTAVENDEIGMVERSPAHDLIFNRTITHVKIGRIVFENFFCTYCIKLLRCWSHFITCLTWSLLPFSVI